MTRYHLQRIGTVELAKSDFKAQGSQCIVYFKQKTAYEIYTDPGNMIHPEKVRELAVLTHPGIIRPQHLILDKGNRVVGYSMKYVDRAFALCQVFPKSYRLRHNFSPDDALHAVRRIQEIVRQVHSQRILIVDLNEMNLLISDDHRDLYFIDVDSFQTPSFPATALMESVRDRHANAFSEGSDWFSFAVVSF